MIKKILDVLPKKVSQSVFHRFMYPPRSRWHPLYENASLAYAPSVSVHLRPQDRMHGQIAFLGYYEELLSRKVVELAKDRGGCFVDVGANIGYFSLLWAAQSPNNKVVAIEASPRVLPLLEENVRRNQLSEQITIVQAAAGKQEGKVEFDLGPEAETGWGGMVKDKTAETVRVDQIRLDNIIEGQVEFLKVDVEGADSWVIQGAEKLLRTKQIRHICFEHNEARAAKLGISKEAPVSYLKNLDYKLSMLGSDHWAVPQE